MASASCPAPDIVLAHVQQDLGTAERTRMVEHLDRCPTCRRWVAELTSLAPQAAPAKAPPTIDRYRLDAPLGAGAMGVVFDAWDPKLERRVAVKVISCPQPDLANRLLGEARALAALRHPNVVQVFDVGRTEDSIYIVMERATGTTLRQWQQGAAPRGTPEATPDRLLRAYVCAAKGLAAVHQAGLTHRDFKPDNVLVDPGPDEDLRILVTDFGLASGVPEAGFDLASVTDPEEPCRTSTGALVGTPAYMAPEQLRGKQASAASDQFSFCVALCEALTGTRPFEAPTLAARLEAIDRGPGVGREKKQTIRGSVARAIRRGLHPDSAQRHQSMHSLVAALQPRRSWARRLGIGVVVLGAVSASAAAISATTSAQQPATSLQSAAADGLATQSRNLVLGRIEHLQALGRHAWALAALQPLLASADRAQRARARYLRGISLRRLRRTDEALEELEAAYGLAMEAQDEVAAAWAALDSAQIYAGPGADLDAASQWVRQAKVALERVEDPPVTLLASSRLTEAALAQQAGEVDRAATGYEEVLALVADGPTSLDTVEADALAGLGDVVPYLSESVTEGYGHSIALYDRALDVSRTGRGSSSPSIFIQAARAKLQPGLHELEAFALLDEAEQHIAASGTASPDLIAAIWMTRGTAYQNLDRHEEAAQAFERCREALPSELRDRHLAGLTCATSRGRSLLAAGHLEQARDLLSRNLDVLRRVMGPDHPMTFRALVRLATTRSQLGQHQLALEHAEEIRRSLDVDESLSPEARAYIENEIDLIVRRAAANG